jgi:hypothetical protein
MLAENKLPHYLPFFSKFESTVYNLYYKITRMATLSYVLEDRELNIKYYLEIMDSIIEAMKVRDQYLLSENSLIIHQDYIFVLPTGETGLIYIPTQISTSVETAFKNFSVWLLDKLDSQAVAASIPLQMLFRESSNFDLTIIKQTLQMVRVTSEGNAPDVNIPQVYEDMAGERKKFKQNEPAKKAKSKPKLSLFGLFGGKKEMEHDAKESERDDLKQSFEEGGRAKNAYLVAPKSRGDELVKIEKKLFTVGRMDTMDLTVNDAGVSRLHSEINFDGYSLYVTDKGSKGGTFVNNKRLAPEQPKKLHDNDALKFYTTEYVVKIVNRDI